jgi:excinuclease UvrABC nuclease subunit
MADKFYLYQHKDPDTGKCVYIGAGSKKRAYKTYQRNSKYLAYFSIKKPNVEIIREFKSKKEICLAERNLINLIRPELNIVMTNHKKYSLNKRIKLSLSHGGTFFSIYCKKTNIFIGEFVNQTEAARVCGVSRSALSNVLCGRSKSLKEYNVKKVGGTPCQI